MAADKFLDGKVALVTGGAAGIGRAISLALARAGAVTVVADVKIDDSEQATHKIIQAEGGKARSLELDVSDFEAVKESFKDLEKELGGLYALVNNAGITADQLMGRMSREQWDKVIGVNLGGCFNCCRAASRVMLKGREGRVINVSSVVARIGRPGQANYAASKSGIEGLTRSLAIELGHRGITVNAVAPGFIDTDMTRALPEEMLERFIENIPLGRSGSIEEVAQAVLFLAGPGASYITGQTLHVNGGLYFG